MPMPLWKKNTYNSNNTNGSVATNPALQNKNLDTDEQIAERKKASIGRLRRKKMEGRN